MLERLGKATTELLLLALSFVMGMAVVLALTWVGALPSDASAPWSLILGGPIWIGAAGATYLTFERMLGRDGDPPRPIEAAAGRTRAELGTGLLIALGAIVIASTGAILLSLIQQLVFSIEVEEQQTIVELLERRDPFELALLTVSAVILAPITEELVFRHMFFRRLLQRAGPIAAWSLPPLAFALAHWNFVGLLIYAWLASVFAMAYLISGRLWVAILVHAGYNAFTLTVQLWAPDALP
ncbi:MAG TPA: CPBP family intramembrane glutamic endopeptidase [Enhygromyxa sp.]|nr:CPBP family intramembrane glutamic endopeptidase [Enhygromyxa sp.]